MLIASIVSSCLALFLHAGMCPEGDKPGMSNAQPEMRTFEHREDRLGFAPESSGLVNVQFELVLDVQPEDGPRGGRGGPGGPGGPSGPGGFGGPEGRGGPRDERAQGDRGPDVQRLMQRIEQLERQLAERQGRGERAMGGPPRDDHREAKRAHKRAGKQQGHQQGHQQGPQGGPFGGPRGGGMGPGRGMGGGGMGGGMGGGRMLPPGGPDMFQRRGEMIDRMRGDIRERAGQRLAERGERMMERGGPRQDMPPQGGPGGQGGPRPEGGPRGQGPREEIRIERRLGDGQGPNDRLGGPNERRIVREGQEIRIEERREGNPGSQNATDPKLQRILNMVERINERLDRLEKQTSHGELPKPQDRPGDAPRPRGPQDGGGRGER